MPRSKASTWCPRSSQMGGYLFLTGKRGIGHRAQVDRDHVADCRKYSWSVGTNGYPEARTKENKLVRLHEFVAGLIGLVRPPGMFYDHRNGRKFDNRTLNIRVASASLNVANQHRISPTKADPKLPHGISFDPSRGKYQVYYNPNGKRISLGRTSSRREAIRRRKTAEKEGVYASR